MMTKEFKEGLEALINKHGIDMKLDTSDFILAEHLCSLLDGLYEFLEDRKK